MGEIRAWVEAVWPILVLSITAVVFVKTELVAMQVSQEHLLKQVKEQDRSLRVENMTAVLDRISTRVGLLEHRIHDAELESLRLQVEALRGKE